MGFVGVIGVGGGGRRCRARLAERGAGAVLAVVKDEGVWVESMLGIREQAPSALDSVRKAAEDALRVTALPGRKTEDWRFTDIGSLYGKRFTTNSPSGGSEDLSKYYAKDVAARVVILDGVLSDQLSDLSNLPSGCFVGSVDGLDADTRARVMDKAVQGDVGPEAGNFFAKLNSACMVDVIAVVVQDDIVVDRPIQLIVASSAVNEPDTYVISHPRVAVVTGRHASVSVVQQGIADGLQFANTCVSLDAGDGAKVSYTVINEGTDQGYQITTMYGTMGRDATTSVVSAGVAGHFSRTMATLDMTNPGAHSEIRGMSVGTGSRIVDLTSRIRHDAPNCTSDQLQKNIATERSRTIFRGRIKVTENGNKTDSSQLCRSLLLSRLATVDAMPVLEIDHDEVKCSHGATVADLEDEQIFYITSRGLKVEDARFLLIRSFVEDVLRSIPLKECRMRVLESIEDIAPKVQNEDEKRAFYSSV